MVGEEGRPQALGSQGGLPGGGELGKETYCLQEGHTLKARRSKEMRSKCLNRRSNLLAASTRKAAKGWGPGLGLEAAGSIHHRSALQVGPPPISQGCSNTRSCLLGLGSAVPSPACHPRVLQASKSPQPQRPGPAWTCGGSFHPGGPWSRLHRWELAGPLDTDGFSGGTSGEDPTCQCRRRQRHGFNPWVGKIPWRMAWQPLQYSCLENPMDRGAWWSTVHGVAKSQI